MSVQQIRCRPAVRISGFHPGDPGSIPGIGAFFDIKVSEKFMAEETNQFTLLYGLYSLWPKNILSFFFQIL